MHTPIYNTVRVCRASPIVNGSCAIVSERADIVPGVTIRRTTGSKKESNERWKRAIAERLKELMANRPGGKVSQQHLERLTRGLLSKSRVGNYYQGTRLLGPEEAVILGDALGVPPAYVMCLEGDMPILNKEERDLIRDWRVLPERDRNDYARRIHQLAQVYRDPVPDERLTDTAYGKPPDPAKQTKKHS